MRLFAIHDHEGKITEAVMCPTDALAPELEVGPGLVFAEVEPPEGFAEDSDLLEFIRSHRVEMAPLQKKSVVPLETTQSD